MNLKHTQCYIEDYPRPQMVRSEWESLNGKWYFRFDERDIGESEHWEEGFKGKLQINVPFSCETIASGINEQKQTDIVWYSRSFLVTELDKDTILHFEGSDYLTNVWINGVYIGENRGGYHRFSFDITQQLHLGVNTITAKVTDSKSIEQPRGKQRCTKESSFCWCVQNTGIYKTVWLERVNPTHVSKIHITTDTEKRRAVVKMRIVDFSAGLSVKIKAGYNGKQIGENASIIGSSLFTIPVEIPESEVHLWSAEHPDLYDLSVELYKNGELIDEVGSYFAFRDIKVVDNRIHLNGTPLYLRMVLDQGYWKESGPTPPSTDAIVKDLLVVKKMGFNGLRKHEKVEDERYLYFADILGLYVWCEMPSMYMLSEASTNRIISEWSRIVPQFYDHPSVISWVLFHASWGVPGVALNPMHQALTLSMYYLTKTMDNSRPIITNDGFEQTKTDIMTIHNYQQDAKVLKQGYETLKLATEGTPIHDRRPFAQGYEYEGQPIIFSEYGGFAFKTDTTGGKWGYGKPAANPREMLTRFEALTDAILSLPYCTGYCYTQLTDVQQEVNGLLKEDRTPKVDLNEIRRVNSKKPKIEE